MHIKILITLFLINSSNLNIPETDTLHATFKNQERDRVFLKIFTKKKKELKNVF